MKHSFFKKIGSFTIVVICLMLNKTGLAQQAKGPLTNPVSPSAAAMFKVLERPIGNYTGTLPISFPLFEITSGDLTAPVSLSYNSTGGVRVEEMATNVGLGFNLDVGGRITRLENGLSDDKPTYGYLNNSVKPSTFNIANATHLAAAHSKQLDLEPDIFMYSFNGQTGKFFFNEMGQVVMMQQSDIKVQYTTDISGINTWTLTDGKGQKFVFSLKETTTNTYTNISGNPNPPTNIYVSSWILSEIKDMNSEHSITFTYQTGTSSFNSYSGGFKKTNQIRWDNYCDSFTEDEVMVNTSVTEYTLTKITGTSGYLNLSSTFDRTDVAGGAKLRSMTWFDYNNNLKKTIKFNYDYFMTSVPLGNTDDRRLKLKNFAEFGSSGTDSVKHSFEYVEYVNLPNRLSRAVDFWGYFNGAYDNSTYFPNTISTFYSTVYRPIGLAERHVNAAYSVANVLKKINYPTGGSRELVYESNTALLKYGDQLRLDPDYTVSRSFYRSDFTYPATYIPTLKHEFRVNSNDGWTTFKYSLETACATGHRVEIYRLSYPGDPGGTLTHTFYDTKIGSWDLANAYYRLEVYRTGSCTFSSIATVWNEYILVDNTINTLYGVHSSNNREVGGLRIKQLKDFDPVSALTNSTEYVYKLYSADSTLTSGFLNTDVRIMNEFNNDCPGTCQYMMLYSMGCYPLANSGGTYVVYPEVRTVESNNGYVDRRYTYQPDILMNVDSYPIIPPNSENAKLRGLLLAERYYNKFGTILTEKGYTYSYLKWDSPGTLVKKIRLYYSRSGSNYCFESGDSPSSNPVTGKSLSYYLKGTVFGLISSTETAFGTTGNHVNTTSYTYDTAGIGRPLIRQIKTVVDANYTKEVNFRYAFNNVADFKFGLTGSEQTMKSLLLGVNYLQPLEVSNTRTPIGGGTTTVLGGTKYSFGTFFSSKYHLLELKEYKSAVDYKMTTFGIYDVKGNVLSKTERGKPSEVYLWGYNGIYPVAKITGSNYSTISAWTGSLNLNSPSNDGALRNDINTIRTNLAGTQAQVEAYTYNPLTGMTSSTDANGVTTFFEYDNFRRLMNIKDRDGKIIRSYEYHYKP